MATGYAVISWLLIQVADTLFPIFAIPDTAIRLLAVSLLIGFFIVVPIAWVFELTPDGIKKTLSAKTGESSKIGLTDYLFGGISLVIIGFIVVRLLLPTGSENAVRRAIDETALLLSEPMETAEEVAPAPSEFSIAVLPLANLSPDPDNAYFAAGIHEEILLRLVKAKQLEVKSRASVLRFEDSELNIQEIARELNVSIIMQGSVRFAGNQVRISTQLIQASDDVQLWSETYQRDFDDIFAIQSDVAIQVANAMQASLTSSELTNIEKVPTNNTEAYSLYLQAIAAERSGDRSGTTSAQATVNSIPLLERAIELDPSFAQALALLATRKLGLSYMFADPARRSALLGEADQYANLAIEIDSNQAGAYAVLARLYWNRKQWDQWLVNARLSVEVPSLGADGALALATDLSVLGLHAAAYHWMDIAISKEPESDVDLYLFAAAGRVSGGDYESSLVFLDQYLERGGLENDYHALRSLSNHFLGRDEESLNELNQIDGRVFNGGALGGIQDYLRCQTTQREQTLQEIDALRNVVVQSTRRLSCALGASDLDTVFSILETYMELNIPVGERLSMYDEAKLDPRWQAVEEYMDLPELTGIQIPY